ncbi:MAG: acyltransferase family protein [Lachnospiraceae bacterium]|nr:acyltransferase family protein [Lachnospiraceae bacterium]
MDRSYALDNLRTITILSLFLFHACEIYHIGEGFFVEGQEQLIPTMVYNFPSPWLMGVLFFIAGMTTVYSLRRRSVSEYYINRLKTVLLPFVVGIVAWVPWETYFVLKNHFDYDGSFLDAYIHYFTHYSEGFLGYDGGFTPSHLWFLIYLLIISFLCFPIIRLIGTGKWDSLTFNSKWLVVLSFVIYIVAYGTTDESIGKFIVYFILGIILAENKPYNEYIISKWKVLIGLGIILNLISAYFLILMKNYPVVSVEYALMRLVWSIGNVVITFGYLGMGKVLMSKSNPVMGYLSQRSFAIYFIHMPVLIATGYYVLEYIHIHYMLQIVTIIVISFGITLGLVNVFKRIPVVSRLLF